MPFEVTMPKLTDSMEEGRIVSWKVAVGDRVGEGDVIAEIETDKAVMELESFRSGVVAELVRRDGDVAAVGEVIARIAGGAESTQPTVSGEPEAEGPPPEPGGQGATRGAEAGVSEAAAPAAPEPQGRRGAEAGDAGRLRAGAPDEVPLPGAHPLAERGGKHSPRPEPPAKPQVPSGTARGIAPTGLKASPRARRLAREKGVDLTGLRGTGPEGRITTADVEAAPVASVSRVAPARVERADEALAPVTFAEGEAEVEEVTFYQKAAVRRVVASKHVIPHFYVARTVRADALRKRREEAGEGVTVTHLVLRACALALEAFPEANRSYDRGRWIRWKVTNLGLAIQTDAGLVVGVLRGAQGKDLAWIADGARRLVERARQGQLKPEERANATFTLSSLGGFGVESFSAIINPPSAMTLAVGAVRPAPVVEDGRVVPADVLNLTLSCDHRVVDGVLAARFLGEVAELLEDPARL